MHDALQAAAEQTVNEVRKQLSKTEEDDAKNKGNTIAAGLSLSALDNITDITDDLSDVASDAGGQWIAGVKIPDSDEMFDRVHGRAVTYAKKRGAELVSGVDEATRNEMAALIADGLEENIGMDAIADRIEAAYAFSEERSELIARTEIAFANQNGVLEGMKEARENGVVIKKVWLPDAEACPICLGNADDGAINLDDNFSSGDDAPPAHPNCECTIASEIEE